MGFYSPASLIGDARRHGVHVRGVDVNASGAAATLEKPETPAGQPVIRLGLAAVRNLGSDPAAVIVAGQPYRDLEDFARRAALPSPALEGLAMAGAFGCFGMSRREALWAAGAAATIRAGQLPGTTVGLAAPPLAAMTAAEETFADLWATIRSIFFNGGYVDEEAQKRLHEAPQQGPVVQVSVHGQSVREPQSTGA